ncbi:sporulation histidine kinase inhibitor Sda [Domibacillus sp. 8LH]
MKEQTDEFIVEAYKKAVKLDLDRDFLLLLEEELERRELDIHREKVC